MTELYTYEVIAGPVLSAPTASVIGILLASLTTLFLAWVDQKGKRKGDAKGHATQLESVTKKYERLNALRAADLIRQIDQLREERDETREKLDACTQARIEDRNGRS